MTYFFIILFYLSMIEQQIILWYPDPQLYFTFSFFNNDFIEFDLLIKCRPSVD